MSEIFSVLGDLIGVGVILMGFVLLGVLFLGASAARGNPRNANAGDKKEPASVRYCPFCASALTEKEINGHAKLACPSCEFVHWDNPKPVTITLVPMDGGLVLVRRKIQPGAGDWALPGGYIEPREAPAAGAAREVLEETGLKVEIDRVLDAVAPSSGNNQVILIYVAKPASGTPVAGDDALEARVFKKEEVPENIAFPLHREMIRRWFDTH